MTNCTSCGVPLSEESRFCSSCGQPANGDSMATRTVAKTPSSNRSPISRTSPSGAFSGNRFAPGTVLAGRYRIVALLGKGGMGEVYRAEDLTLEQQVALKFLPEDIAANADALARFRNEVRLARQVSHPNVCRVYDVVEVEDHIFLSMEYVDGEDLGSLLRRIGRLPSDKALEIARKLCAGLAAAHEKGVLHRDLKPSNVMLDSRGQVLLADFGLAGLTDQVVGNDVRSGTPAYMAPEQLAGKEVTARSDIYSLGLVFYELFTGKRPFEANTLADLVRARLETTPTSLSETVRDLDPAVERAILRCLDPEPSLRPSSALAVAAALPGGDPLAAALAAGETPSPKMVAAAGEGVGLAPRIAVPLFVAAIAGLIGYAILNIGSSAIEQVQPQYSPDVLSQKAREIIQRLGYSSAPADSAYGLDWDSDYINYVQSHDKPSPRWTEVLTSRLAPLQFWYRESPYPLVADTFHDDLLTPGMVDDGDPPPILSGMIGLRLDSQGRLIRFEVMPAQVEKPAKEMPAVDWNPLFASAGLDASQYHPTEPLRTWLAAFDTRAAWTGTWPGTSRALRVEAAAWRGKPVAFALIGDWTRPDRAPEPPSGSERGRLFLLMAIVVVLIGGAGFLARRNTLRGRGDHQGAMRLAVWVVFMQLAIWLCRGHFVASFGTFGMFLLAICTSVFYGVVVCTMYIALEPAVRRRWPQTLIAWSAALTGRARDPIVGRDILIGVLLEVWLRNIDILLNRWAFGTQSAPNLGSTEVLLGARRTLGAMLTSVPHGVRDTLLLVLVLFLLRGLVRNQWLAGAGMALIFATLNALSSTHPIFDGVESFFFHGLLALLILRFGLLALAGMILAETLLNSIQFTSNVGAWYFGDSALIFGAVLAMVCWGFYRSIAGQRLWKEDLFG